MLKRFEQGNAENFFSQTVTDMYRQKYFEALDLVINCVKNRFDQPGYKVLRNVEDLLIKAMSSNFENYSHEFTFVTKFYEKDIDKDSLKVQLETLRMYFEKEEGGSVSLSDIFGYVRKLKPAMRSIYSEIVTLVRILLVIAVSYKCHK